MYYFDHNATSPLAPEVAEVFSTASREVMGNPSSTHGFGQMARAKLEESRRTLAKKLCVSAAEIVFTSGGTESNNLAILGSISLMSPKVHVVTTAIEHPSVLETCRFLERKGAAVTYCANAESIPEAIRDETVLVCAMHANNETGAILPVEMIARAVVGRRAAGQPIYFHSDGVQAFGKIPVDLTALDADYYSLSAHKIFGPKGIGALFVRKGAPLEKVQFGGRHERDRRPGTENVPGAMAFARAAELCDVDSGEVGRLRDQFEASLLTRLGEIKINAPGLRLPNTSNVLFRGVSAESLVIALDTMKMAVSTGSACSSGSLEPSHVLLAMGLPVQDARSSVRFSFGRFNTGGEIVALTDAVVASVERLRRRNATEVRRAG